MKKLKFFSRFRFSLNILLSILTVLLSVPVVALADSGDFNGIMPSDSGIKIEAFLSNPGDEKSDICVIALADSDRENAKRYAEKLREEIKKYKPGELEISKYTRFACVFKAAGMTDFVSLLNEGIFYRTDFSSRPLIEKALGFIGQKYIGFVPDDNAVNSPESIQKDISAQIVLADFSSYSDEKVALLLCACSLFDSGNTDEALKKTETEIERRAKSESFLKNPVTAGLVSCAAVSKDPLSGDKAAKTLGGKTPKEAICSFYENGSFISADKKPLKQELSAFLLICTDYIKTAEYRAKDPASQSKAPSGEMTKEQKQSAKMFGIVLCVAVGVGAAVLIREKLTKKKEKKEK